MQVSALLQSENKLVLADDIACDWLNPKLVMSNICSNHFVDNGAMIAWLGIERIQSFGLSAVFAPDAVHT
jgi:tRNA A37 threonylcarbamoyltransferase TsaD